MGSNLTQAKKWAELHWSNVNHYKTKIVRFAIGECAIKTKASIPPSTSNLH